MSSQSVEQLSIKGLASTTGFAATVSKVKAGSTLDVSSLVGHTLTTCENEADNSRLSDYVCSAEDMHHLCHETREKLKDEVGVCDVTDHFLRKCLVYNKLSAEKASKTCAGFLRFRHAADWPLLIPRSAVEKALQTGAHWLIPRRRSRNLTSDYVWKGNTSSTDGGPAACVVWNAAALDSALCTAKEYQKMSCYLMEQLTDDIQVQQRGLALIMDFDQMELSRLFSLIGSEDMCRGVLLWKGAFPCRLRRVWFINVPYALRLLIWGTLQMLKPYVRERVRVAHRSSGLSAVKEDLGDLFELPHTLGGDVAFDWRASLESCLKGSGH